MIPAKEINLRDRDSFWKKEEEEERRRVEVEKDRRQQELQKVEEVGHIVDFEWIVMIGALNNKLQERRAREEKEHNERERKIAINDVKSPTNNVTPITRYAILCL